jgi:hypothetical protein
LRAWGGLIVRKNVGLPDILTLALLISFMFEIRSPDIAVRFAKICDTAGQICQKKWHCVPKFKSVARQHGFFTSFQISRSRSMYSG